MTVRRNQRSSINPHLFSGKLDLRCIWRKKRKPNLREGRKTVRGGKQTCQPRSGVAEVRDFFVKQESKQSRESLRRCGRSVREDSHVNVGVSESTANEDGGTVEFIDKKNAIDYDSIRRVKLPEV